MADEAVDRNGVLSSVEALTMAIAIRSIPMVLEPLMTTGLTIQQLKVLSVVVTTDRGATGAGLAQTFGVSLAAVSRIVDRLVAQDLVSRAADDTDHRVRRVSATPLGRAVVRELMAARPELGAEVLGRLELDELRALEHGLRALDRELRALRD